ncbi:MAG: hypothetical protein WED09_11540 [Homoserinimonas sp.]
MTNTPPPSNNDDASNGRTDAPDRNSAARGSETENAEPETPLFDDVATEHPEAPIADDSQEPAASAEPVPLVEPATPQPAPVIPPPAPTAQAPVQEERTEAPEAVGYDERIEEPRVTEQRPAQAPAATSAQTVYVTAPVAPKARGNRGFGLLFALLALIVFALLFVGIMAIVLYAIFSGNMADRLMSFVSSTAFIVPLAVFIVAFAILVLLTNRAGWWAYVLGSFLVALAVYFGSIGVVLLTGNVFGMTATAAAASFWSLAASPPIIIAGVLAREVTIWFGAAIASRGRKVKERNLEAKAAYERELDNQPLGFS